MALIPDRSTLESLRRADLQKLCKDHGLRANMKSEQLIDLLLDTAQAAQQHARQTRRSASVRSTSRDNTTSNVRGRVGSMIIHDLTEVQGGGEQQEGGTTETVQSGPRDTSPSQPPPPQSGHTVGPATRTRKAKESQYKLGLGRPKTLGGAGARKVSKAPPSGFVRGKRVKASVSIQPGQAAIQEEDEEAAMPMEEDEPIAGPSGTTHESPPRTNVSEAMNTIPRSPKDPAEGLNLRDQLQSLRSELLRLTSQATDVVNLRNTVAQLTEQVQDLKIQSSRAEQLEQEMRAMKEEMAALKTSRLEGSNHHRMDSVGRATDASTSQTAIGSPTEAAAHVTKTMLGKRQRESAGSPAIGVDIAPTPTSDEPSENVVRPVRKRQRLAERESSGEPVNPAETSVIDTELVADEDALERPGSTRTPSFTVFSGPEEPPDNAPPTTRLSDVFGTVTPRPDSTVGTTTASASENQPPSAGGAFSFDFRTPIFPLPSTSASQVTPGPQQQHPPQPAYSAFPVNIPAPQPPTSPTPVPGGVSPTRLGTHRTTSHPPPTTAERVAQRQRSTSTSNEPVTPPRAHAAQSSLFPLVEGGAGAAESSSSSNNNAPSSAFAINPASLEFGASLGLPGYVALPVPPETPAPPKRTLYGTELAMDTRFGDFGVEGVATGFWTGAAPRF